MNVRMGLTINSSSLLEKRFLKVESEGVKFYQSAFIGGTRRFRFREIQCILMSPANLLSFQVGNEVFSLTIKPDKAKHQEVLAAFVNGVLAANGMQPT